MATTRNLRPHYTIQFKIGDLDLSARLDQFILINSIETIYQIAFLSFKIDAKDYINERLYGQEPIIVKVILTNENRIPQEQTEFILIALNPMIDLSLKQNDNQPDGQTTDMMSLICILAEPFTIMSTPVNRTYLKLKGDSTKPIDIANDLIKKYAPNAKTDIQTDNANDEEFDQVMIPNGSLAKAIKYLDTDFGIYKGPYFNFCSYKDNTFQLWDISKAIKKMEVLEVILLSLGKGCTTARSEEDDVESTDGITKFHTYQPLEVLYGANKNIISEGWKHKIILKPYDKLYETLDINANELFNQSSVRDGNQGINNNKKVENRTLVHMGMSIGLGSEGTFLKSRLSDYLSRMSRIKFVLNGNVALENLTKIGLPVKITPKVQEYLPYQGKYIVSSSVLKFSRELTSHWRCTTTMRGFRGNVEI